MIGNSLSFNNDGDALRFARHKRMFVRCTACPLHRCRSQVVFARGVIPCEVLFIGEAPGQSEDNMGFPFVGEAGHLLQSMIDEVDAELQFTYAFTNIVACLPTSLPENPDADDGSRPIRDPLPKEAEACSDRLASFINIAKPLLIVALGRIAFKYTNVPKTVILPLMHPSAILRRTSEIAKELDRKNFTIRLTRAVLCDAVTAYTVSLSPSRLSPKVSLHGLATVYG